MRHSIAKATRNLLKQGGNGVVPYDIPDSQTLQEYALQTLLKEKWGPSGDLDLLVDKVIVGKISSFGCFFMICTECVTLALFAYLNAYRMSSFRACY